MEIRGTARKNSRTKDLVKKLKPGEIAVINHPDLDQVAAESLIKADVKMVINASPSITGRYPNLGPMLLVEAGIPILDAVGPDCFNALPECAEIEIKGGRIYRQAQLLGEGVLLTPERIRAAIEEAKKNLNHELDKFIQNTLEYALVEKDLLLGDLKLPPLRTSLYKKQVLVVVRGQNYREDLRTILSYVREEKPVLIGVDGGADALLEFGLKPHLIIGDMDSVSNQALRCGAELVVHAYPNGRAPGLKRIRQLDLEAVTFPAPGTSEDLALILAYEKGADLIVAVGTHSNMIDFLEKGRPGMASTFLVRLKVGSILVDARGVSKLYHSRIKGGQIFMICLAAFIPFILVLSLNKFFWDWLRLLWLKLRLLLKI
ncbi:putative cytokinetic ring protein SteA [Capillibacterium thermochitinicola]|uniref:Membrane-anchored protein n=1 Tax=Capillibacterium thermochitinicola TaxID=2699427 RepID=A0A8J6LJF4_9FIRM|nr:putative cytokinetic ring protein SteA [Capillibacterium thermochitinicola]MBA2133801.1 hypothetical protein [Capillibacterium thermochitinicola]